MPETCAPVLPSVRIKDPRPATGPASLGAFLDSVSGNDAVLEVMVGQGRILTTKVNLTVAGKVPASVAVGVHRAYPGLLGGSRRARFFARA